MQGKPAEEQGNYWDNHLCRFSSHGLLHRSYNLHLSPQVGRVSRGGMQASTSDRNHFYTPNHYTFLFSKNVPVCLHKVMCS